MHFVCNSHIIKTKKGINKNKNHTNKMESSNKHRNVNKNDRQVKKDKIIKKIKRTNKNIIQLVCSLKEKPNYFISLTFVREDGPMSVSPKDGKEYLLDFIDELKDEYGDSWHICVGDYGYINKFHFHLFTHIDYDIPEQTIKNKVKKVWNDTIDSNLGETSHVAEYEDRDLMYQTFGKDLNELKKLDKKLKGSKLYTKKYIPKNNYYEPIIFKLTLLELRVLQDKILDYLFERNQNPKSELDQLFRKAGMISFIPHEEYKRMFDEVVVGRNGKSFTEMLKEQREFLTKREKRSRYSKSWNEI